VARWCRLVEAIGASAAEPDLTLDRPPVPPPVPRATLVHPGAAAPARRWPAERWARVIDALADAGHRIVLTGSTAEQHLTGHVAAMAGSSVLDLGGRTSVIELAALVADARVVLCGDTGVAHLASAYAVPSVVLFGPTSPATWGPPPSGPHVALWSGSTGDPHGSTPDPGLLRIEVETVLRAVEAGVGAARSTANR
jgi:ADP-heptose:LPS heptosyltransferase